MLRHRVCGISCHIRHRNTPALYILHIHVVGSGGCDTDIFQLRRFPQRFLIHHNLIRKHHIGIPGSLSGLLVCRKRIYLQLPEPGKFTYVHIISKAVLFQKYNPHTQSSSLVHHIMVILAHPPPLCTLNN